LLRRLWEPRVGMAGAQPPHIGVMGTVANDEGKPVF
jgi:hypothetical protein